MFKINLIGLAVVLAGLASAGAHDIDLKRLPLGDGKISKAPKAGWVWA